MVHKRENARKILFDFLKNRKYNNYKRVAGKRKSSLPAARFLLLKNNSVMKECVACRRKSSLFDRLRIFLCRKREE